MNRHVMRSTSSSGSTWRRGLGLIALIGLLFGCGPAGSGNDSYDSTALGRWRTHLQDGFYDGDGATLRVFPDWTQQHFYLHTSSGTCTGAVDVDNHTLAGTSDCNFKFTIQDDGSLLLIDLAAGLNAGASLTSYTLQPRKITSGTYTQIPVAGDPSTGGSTVTILSSDENGVTFFANAPLVWAPVFDGSASWADPTDETLDPTYAPFQPVPGCSLALGATKNSEQYEIDIFGMGACADPASSQLPGFYSYSSPYGNQ